MFNAPLHLHQELSRDRHEHLLLEARRAQADRGRVGSLRPVLALSVIVLALIAATLFGRVAQASAATANHVEAIRPDRTLSVAAKAHLSRTLAVANRKLPRAS